jgi:stress response protein YsnF
LITIDNLKELDQAEVYDRSGDHIGTVGRVFVDEGGKPEWVTVKSGLLHFQQSFVPLTDAELDCKRLTVAVEQDRVKDAPLIDADSPLSRDHAHQLHVHYGMSDAHPDGLSNGHEDGHEDGHQETSMTRSEERLVAHTERQETGRVRLRRYLVTEEVQVAVPVTREEVRLEAVPPGEERTGENGHPSDGRGSEVRTEDARADVGDAHEMILHAERPIITTETVPVERVRLTKQTVHDRHRVEGEVRKERIDYEGPDPA